MPEARPWFRLALFALILGAAFLLAWQLGLFRLRDAAELATAIRQAREQRFVIPLFVLIYAAAATVGLPGTVLTLAGGAMFGTVLGSLLNWLGAVMGAVGAYLLARALGRDAVRYLLGSRIDALDRVIASHGFITLLRLRLIPVVPFNALNFGAGLAGVRASDFLAATAIGIVPGTVVFTYFADSVLTGIQGARQDALFHAAIAGALLILLTFAGRWRARRSE